MLKGLLEALDKALVGTPDWVAVPVLLGFVALSCVVYLKWERRRERKEMEQRARAGEAREQKGEPPAA